MSDSAKLRGILFILLTVIFAFDCNAAATADSVTLFTPYTRITVPPGESINYSVDVINNSKDLRNMEITVSGIPRSWNYTLTSGSYKVGQIAIMVGQKQTLSFMVDVPLNVNKGSYRFTVSAGAETSLPLVVVVSEQGYFRTEFTTKQSNIQGHSASTFTYRGIAEQDCRKATICIQECPEMECYLQTFYNQATSRR